MVCPGTVITTNWQLTKYLKDWFSFCRPAHSDSGAGSPFPAGGRQWPASESYLNWYAYKSLSHGESMNISKYEELSGKILKVEDDDDDDDSDGDDTDEDDDDDGDGEEDWS
jgi:hypothetical protein